ncbi:MAG: hypothetical protein ACPGSD_14050 [Flavobacteriales bacterium]
MKIEEIESGILINNIVAAGDGGSIYFECETTLNNKFDLLFTQHVFLEHPNPEMLPGRIYLNQKIIELKSKEEKLILSGLKKNKISLELLETNPKINSSLTQTINNIQKFFESELPLEIKEKIDKAMEG